MSGWSARECDHGRMESDGGGGSFDTSLWAALGLGIGVGSAMMVVGLIVATDWHGAARRYSDLTFVQSLPWSRSTEDERFEQQVVGNRITFGLTGLLGLALFVGGLVSVFSRIH